MSTATAATSAIQPTLDALLGARILNEGYGPGAWHGADFKAALAELSPRSALWRPAPERHNVAEIALHHAWTVRSVRGRLTGEALEPFPLEGEDWFEVTIDGPLDWSEIGALVEAEQQRIARAVADIGAGRITSPQTASEQLDLVLGVTGHAIYHAGQVQLLKVLEAQRR